MRAVVFVTNLERKKKKTYQAIDVCALIIEKVLFRKKKFDHFSAF